MLKELDVIKIDNCNIGDVCWIVVKHESRPLHGTINGIYKDEDAIQVTTTFKGFRVVRCMHAFWNEKDAISFRKANKNNL